MSRAIALRLACAGFALATLFTAGQRAAAATYTWGGASSLYWSDTGNWSSNVVPGGGDDGAVFLVGHIHLSAGLDGRLVTGRPVGHRFRRRHHQQHRQHLRPDAQRRCTVNGNAATGIEMDPGAARFRSAPRLCSARRKTWLNNSSNLLAVSGGVANGGYSLTIAGSGNTNLTGGLSGAGGLTMNGTGLAYLSGNGVNYSGNTTVSSGTLEVYNTRNFSNGANAANTITIAGGAMLQIYADNSSGNVGDGANQLIGTNTGTGTTITGAGIFQKTGNGELASAGAGSGAGYGFLTVAMSPGGLIDIEGGILKNGGWSGTNWAGNQASMLIGPSGELDLWDGPAVYVDALNGSGIVDKNQSQSNGDLLVIGVNNGSGTFSGIIRNSNTTGVLAITKTGSGLEVFSGSNTYGGGTTIGGGTLQLNNTNAVQNSTVSVNVNNGLAFGNGITSVTLGALGGTGNLALTTQNSLAVALTAGGNGATTTYSGLISGGGTLTKTGGGAMYLSNTGNSYSGGTNVNAGILNFSTSGLGTGPVNFGGGTLQWAAGNTTDISAVPVTINAGGATFDTGANSSITLANAIGNNGSGGLTKVGTGTLTLGGSNSFAGGTTISAGMLSVGSIADSGPSNLSTGGITLSGGTLQYTGSVAVTTTRAFTATSANNSAISVSNASGVLNINTGITGNLNSTLVKWGPGTLTLSGNADNSNLVLDAEAGTVNLNKGVAGNRAVAGISNIAAGASVVLTGTNGDQIYGGGTNRQRQPGQHERRHLGFQRPERGLGPLDGQRPVDQQRWRRRHAQRVHYRPSRRLERFFRQYRQRGRHAGPDQGRQRGVRALRHQYVQRRDDRQRRGTGLQFD